MKTPSNDGGQLLQQLREQAGFSRLGLEQQAGIGINNLSKYESGKRKSPTRKTLERILDVLNVTYADRKEILEAFGYTIEVLLPTDQDIAVMVAQCKPELDQLWYPAWLMDTGGAMLAWNRHVPEFLQILDEQLLQSSQQFKAYQMLLRISEDSRLLGGIVNSSLDLLPIPLLRITRQGQEPLLCHLAHERQPIEDARFSIVSLRPYESFHDLLEAFYERSGRNIGSLSHQTAISYDTLKNWLSGRVRSLQDSEDLVTLADALLLDDVERTLLLRLAGFIVHPVPSPSEPVATPKPDKALLEEFRIDIEVSSSHEFILTQGSPSKDE